MRAALSLAFSTLLVGCSTAPTTLETSTPARAAATTVLEGARVFDGERDIGEAVIVIEDGVIAQIGAPANVWVPEGAQRIDYRGRYVMPGLITNHSHVGMVSGVDQGAHLYSGEIVRAQLEQFQAYGVTTVVVLGMNPPPFIEIRDTLNARPEWGSSLFGAGRGLGAPEGAPPAGGMNLHNGTVERPESADAARQAVRAAVDEDVDVIKLWVDDMHGNAPIMASEVFRAAIDEAHRHGLKVAAHIHDLAPARELVEAGVNIIAHGVRDAPVDAALVEAMLERGTGYIATVNINEAEYLYAERPELLQDPFFRAALSTPLRERFEDPAWRRDTLAGDGVADARRAVAMNLRNLRTLHDAGVTIGFGTDSGATPLRIPGFAEHRELELMTSAGLSPSQALVAATSDAAKLMAFEDRGLLRPGRRADLLVLEADPTADILNTRRIHAVWQQGEHVRGAVTEFDADAAAARAGDH